MAPALASLVFMSCRVAGDAVGEVGNPFFQVFPLDFGRVVFVTAVAGIGGQGAGVASRAGDRAAVIKREGMRAGELRRPPGAGGVALLAGGAE